MFGDGVIVMKFSATSVQTSAGTGSTDLSPCFVCRPGLDLGACGIVILGITVFDGSDLSFS